MMNVNCFEWLIVGLGNPGVNYEKTRHNIGWMVLDYIAEKFSLEYTHRMYFNTFELNIHEHNVAFIKPNIFMNNSGEPVQRFSSKYDILPRRILIIHDEINFPVGKIHIRPGGSDGGHNGVASVIEKLGTISFPRLRCGIGNNFGAGEMSKFVLSEFEESEKELVKIMIKNAAEVIESIINNGFDKTMSLVNSNEL